MADKTQFDEVIEACGYTEYHKDILRPYYNDALEFIMDAGVSEAVAKSKKAVGCIVRYIMDTYNMNSNNVTLSKFFFQRLKQLQMKCQGVSSDEEITEGESS